MAFSVEVRGSEVKGERRVTLLDNGVHMGNVHARNLEQATTLLEARMRMFKNSGFVIRETDIATLLQQLRERWS